MSKPDFPTDLLGHALVAIVTGCSAVLLIMAFLQSQNRAERGFRLYQEQNRIAMAAQAANIGLWAWEIGSETLWGSPAAVRALGFPPETPITIQAFLSRVQESDREEVKTLFTRALKADRSISIRFRYMRDDGQLRWLRMRAGFFQATQGVQLSGALVDITEQHKVEAEVETQRKSLTHLTRVDMLGQLGGALAHELRQPLTAILSNAQALQRLLERGAVDMVEVRAVVRDIIQDDSRAADVIRHLRSLLKKDEFRGEALDVNEVVSQTLKLMRNDLIVRKIVTSIKLHGERLPVVGDTVQLQQLLLNLILNAVEAMVENQAKGGTLTVATALQGSAAHIMVSDTGPGLKEEVLEKLFEPFVSTKMNGLGLGLSISRAIAATHHGRIWAENNATHGATFHISIPLAKETA